MIINPLKNGKSVHRLLDARRMHAAAIGAESAIDADRRRAAPCYFTENETSRAAPAVPVRFAPE